MSFVDNAFDDKPTLKPFQQLFNDTKMAPREANVASNAFFIRNLVYPD